MEMSRWLTRSVSHLELSPSADCRSEARGRLCGMNGLSEQYALAILSARLPCAMLMSKMQCQVDR